MKLEKLVPYAEVFSSVVVITLIYLAIQTQQTNSALLANSRTGTLAADVAMIAALMEHPEILANAQRPMAELTLRERWQLGNTFAGIMRIREFA